jgi:tetratricopeptide (TPR) repeat protein
MTKLMRSALIVMTVMFAQLTWAQTADEGLEAIQLEQWDKAISIYSAITKATPADQNAWLTLSNMYLAKGNKDEAMKALKSAFDAKPEGGMAFVANARTLLLQGQAAEAEKQMEKAKKYGRKDINALRQLGETFLYYVAAGDKKPNLTRAETLLKEANESNSKDYATLLALGQVYRDMNNGGEATRFYEFASLQEAKKPLPVFMQAKMYKYAKLPERYVQFAQKALALNPNYAPALQSLANHYYFSKPPQWEKALEAQKNLMAKVPGLPIEEEMQLANLLYINKDYKGTLETVDKVLAKDQSRNYLRRLKAYCAYETQNYAEGLNIMKDYWKIVPADKVIPRDYLIWANLLIKSKGDTTEAIKNLITYAQRDTFEGWKEYKTAADLQYGRKDFCSAVKTYRMYMDSLPTPPANLLFNVGFSQYYCREDSMRYQNAEKTFLKVTEMMPNAAIGWLWLGKARSKMEPDIEANPALINEFGKAMDAYEKYLPIAEKDKAKNKSNLIASYEYLSYAYYKKGMMDKFNPMLAKLVEIDPANATGKGFMDMLNGGTTPALPGTPGAPTTPPTTTPVPGGGSKN